MGVESEAHTDDYPGSPVRERPAQDSRCGAFLAPRSAADDERGREFVVGISSLHCAARDLLTRFIRVRRQRSRGGDTFLSYVLYGDATAMFDGSGWYPRQENTGGIARGQSPRGLLLRAFPTQS